MRIRFENIRYFPILVSMTRVIKLRKMRRTGHVARVGGRGVYRVLVRNPEGKSTLGRPRRRLKDNIKMGLQEEGQRRMDWNNQAREGGGGHL